MKLLHANDRRGVHAPSWYQDSCQPQERPALEKNVSADVCVIGAGYTGLACALELARCGRSVVVLDAHRVGWGASGRNGGQLGSGFNRNQLYLERLLGRSQAHALWQAAESAKALVHDICQRHAIDIDYRPGIVYAMHRQRLVKPLHNYCRLLAREYAYDKIQCLDRAGIRGRVGSDGYHGGSLDMGAGHIHAFKLAVGLARAAESSGAQIHELSEAVRVDALRSIHGRTGEQRVITATGSVQCGSVVYAANGYLDDLHPQSNRWVMPINNFIVVSEPLGKRAEHLLPFNDAVADSRFVVNYFRRVGGDRLLFGGGENYSYHFPRDIEHVVRRAMLRVFPDLADVGIDYCWGGTLAITRSRLPYVRQLSPGSYSAGGYSGHGVALAVHYGTAIAEHIDARPDRYDTLAAIVPRTFPGGTLGRPALLALAMTGYSWLDRL